MSDPAANLPAMGYERVETHLLERVIRLRAWASGNPAGWQFRKVTYGTSSRGWFAQRIGQTWSGAWLVPDERAACELIERWMHTGENRDRTWTPMPASFGADNVPDDGGTWYRSGGQWFPGEAPSGQIDESSVNHF